MRKILKQYNKKGKEEKEKRTSLLYLWDNLSQTIIKTNKSKIKSWVKQKGFFILFLFFMNKSYKNRREERIRTSI